MGEIGVGVMTFLAIELAVNLLLHDFANQLVSDLLLSIDAGGQLITNLVANIADEPTKGS